MISALNNSATYKTSLTRFGEAQTDAPVILGKIARIHSGDIGTFGVDISVGSEDRTKHHLKPRGNFHFSHFESDRSIGAGLKNMAVGSTLQLLVVPSKGLLHQAQKHLGKHIERHLGKGFLEQPPQNTVKIDKTQF
jgi:hypothetical protein